MDLSDAVLINVPKWQIRIQSHEPAEINYNEEMRSPNLRPVLDRCRTLVGRTSYMVNGPNREVYWSIERWVADGKTKPQWVTVIQGRSIMRKGLKPA